MSASNLADEIEKLILASMESYTEEVLGVQEVLYSQLVNELKGLELDQDGYIKQSAANRAILTRTENIIEATLPGEQFTASISSILSTIPEIDALNVNYFSSISDSFKENRNFIKSLQAQTVETIEKTLLEDGLTAQIKLPLSGILNRNINIGGQFKGFLQEVKTFVEGDAGVDGKILSYSRTFLSDTLFNYSRAYQESITADLKLDWYLYAGGLMDKSRPFCVERAGNYYHRSEIEAWADLEWQGKRQGTTKSSIFIFVAGHNCRHQLIPIHTSIVPKDDLNRIEAI